MNYLYQCLIAFVLVAFSTISQDVKAATNPCFDYQKKWSSQCSDYVYDKIDAYFRDATNTEHQVILYRVKTRASGQLVHVHYDFVISYSDDHQQDKVVLQEGLWAFRNALLNNQLYEKVILACDPTVEVCCHEYGCNEIYSVDQQTQLNTPKNSDVSAVGRSGGVTKFERFLTGADAALSIHHHIARNSRNAGDYQQQFSQQQAKPTLFALRKINEGSYKVMMLTAENLYEDAEGIIRLDPDLGLVNVDVAHNWGAAHNDELHQFLRDVLQIGVVYTRCTQSTECNGELENLRCTVKMSCRQIN